MNAWEGYRILEVSPRAGWEEIRSRFTVLVYACHPDRHPDNPEAAARFRRVMAAYGAIRAARARSRKRSKEYYRTDFRVNDELFEEFFGIASEDKEVHTSGPDFRYDLRIPFLAAVQGVETTIEVPRLQYCFHCAGAGQVGLSHASLCPDCQGKGYRPLGPGLLRLGPVCGSCQGPISWKAEALSTIAERSPEPEIALRMKDRSSGRHAGNNGALFLGDLLLHQSDPVT